MNLSMLRYLLLRYQGPRVQVVCATRVFGGHKTREAAVWSHNFDYWLEETKPNATMTPMHPRALFTSIQEADEVANKFVDAGFNGDFRIQTQDTSHV